MCPAEAARRRLQHPGERSQRATTSDYTQSHPRNLGEAMAVAQWPLKPSGVRVQRVAARTGRREPVAGRSVRPMVLQPSLPRLQDSAAAARALRRGVLGHPAKHARPARCSVGHCDESRREWGCHRRREVRHRRWRQQHPASPVAQHRAAGPAATRATGGATVSHWDLSGGLPGCTPSPRCLHRSKPRLCHCHCHHHHQLIQQRGSQGRAGFHS